MNEDNDSEKDVIQQIKELERRIGQLESIKYKYYCLGFTYFIILIFFILLPIFGNLFDLTSNYLFLITLIYFSIIFFGEVIYKVVKILFKSNED